MRKSILFFIMLLAMVTMAFSQRTIVATAHGGGTITPSDTVLVYGADTTFTVTPDPTYHTDSVVVNGVNIGTPTSFIDTVSANHSVDAYFSINTYQLEGIANTGGSINPSGTFMVDHGTDTSFTITPDAGYHIDSVLFDGANLGVQTTVTLDSVIASHTVEAFFSLDMVDVMFEVNMSVEAMKGNFNPNEDTVYVGDLTSSNYWTMSDNDNDSVYTFTYSDGYPGDTLWFKFGYFDFSQTVIASEADPVRDYVIPMGGGTYSDYFDRDSVYTPPPVDVTFNADMWVKIKKGTFDPSADILIVSGNFNGWGEADTLMDGDVDSVYSKTVQPGMPGDTLSFKFRYYDMSESNWVWEDNPNREYIIPAGGGTYEDFFNRDSVYVEQFDITVYFSVNMELERLSGRFDPSEDTVSVNGSFNGWTPRANILTPNGLNPDIYEGIDTIRGGVGESFYFKFWYEDNNWESISDRVFTFADSNITSGEAFINESFNNGTLETVLNQPATITFTCNTNGAISSVTNNPFASVQSVHVAGSASPLQWPSGGWPNSEINIVLELFDDGSNGDATAGDGIFSADITFPSFTVLDVQYKYSINWGIDSLNEGGNDNEAGFAVNHELHMTKNLSSATTVDTFGVMGDVTLENPVGIGNDNSGILPLKFGLNQNYPNPFNPSTQIKYTLAAASPVMLKVYDMLGREVETLVNGTQNAGEYTLSFSAKNLPSGVYYYRLTTSNFVETKTMMLVK